MTDPGRPALFVDRLEAVVFDTDGVLTDTASVHAVAWKRLFDEHLQLRAVRGSEPFQPFTEADYLAHVDGRPRYDGVAGFLASRGIQLPWGDPGDPPDRETVCGLGNTKDQFFVAHLRDQGAQAFPTSVAFVRRLRERGLRTAAVSASRNMVAVLESAGLRELFDAEVDGVQADRLGLAGKPDPALFLEAARRLGVAPARPRWSRTPWPEWRRAAAAGSGWWSGWTVAARLPPWPSGAPTWSSPTSGSSRSKVAPSGGVTGERLDPGLRRLRPAGRAAPGGAVHPRQRLLRHPRGRPEAAADAVHYPGTYVAGIYNRLVSRVAGREVENEDLVNAPNWLPLTFRPQGGRWLDLDELEVLGYRQELDLRRGVLTRLVRVRDPDGRATRVTQRRFVSMADPHLAGLETTVVPENWSGSLEVRSALDGTVTNGGVERYKALDGRHLVPIEAGAIGDDTVWLQVETRTSRVRIAQAASTRVVQDGQRVAVERRTVQEPGFVAQHLTVDVRQGEPVTVEKLVALYTSKDRAIAEAGDAARGRVERLADGFDRLLERHVLAWDQLWRRCHIDLGDDGDQEVARTLNLHVFHLLQTVSEHTIDLDVGVPRGGCTARPTGATSSGTSCSSSRS